MRGNKLILGLISLLLSMLIVACGGGGGSSSSSTPLGDSGGFTGTAVDPYIVGAVFEEIAADGVTVLQRESTPSNNQGEFTFSKSITPGSTISMKIGRKGLHEGTPYQGLLRRVVESEAVGLIVSPLTTILANGVTEQELLLVLSDAGITGLTVADLYADPVAPLLGQSLRVTDQNLRLLHANMAINNLMEARNNFQLDSDDLNSLENSSLLGELVVVNQDLFNQARFNQLAVDASLAVGSSQPLLFDDVIKSMVGAVQTIVALIKEQPSLADIDFTIIDNAVADAQTSHHEAVIAQYEQRIDVVPPVDVDGVTVFNANCANCHTVNGSGGMDLSNDGSLANTKINSGHRGITLTSNELQALVSYLDTATPTDPTPEPDPTPTPVDGQTLYDNDCAGCHSLGNYDTLGSLDLSGSGSILIAKINAGHRGVVLTSDEVSAVAVWVVNNTIVTPVPDPTPDPVAPDGIALYESECQGCHGQIDSNDIVDRTDVAIQDAIDLNSGGMGALMLTAEEITAIADALPVAPDPEPTPDPVPVNGQSVYDDNCAACHSVNGYEATGYAPDLANTSTTIGPKLSGSHQGITLTSEEQTELGTFVDQYQAVATGPDYSDCTACHGQPPATGSHVVHNALAGVSCASCHAGAEHNGQIDLAFASSYNAKNSIASNNGDGTCSNISCHGGQTTPDWDNGSLVVNTQCQSCHRSGTDDFNSYNSGEHRKHVSSEGYNCSVCHNTSKLSPGHFADLDTSSFGTDPATTVAGGSTRFGSYNGSTCSSIQCHGSETW